MTTIKSSFPRRFSEPRVDFGVGSIFSGSRGVRGLPSSSFPTSWAPPATVTKGVDLLDIAATVRTPSDAKGLDFELADSANY